MANPPHQAGVIPMLMVKESSTVIFVSDFGQPDEKSVREVRRTLKYISRSLCSSEHLLSYNFDITDWIPRINSAIIQALCPMNDRKFWPWRMDCAITKPWRNFAIAFWHQVALLGMFVCIIGCKNEPEFEP